MLDNLQKLADDIGDLGMTVVANQWKAQGHILTGSAFKQMETMVNFQINTLIIEGLIPDYMAYNNSGVKAERIPYYPGSGRKESEYIKGLMRYAKQRFGASDKESKSIAFAIASKHKKEGMPTKASAKYSSTGKRTGFIETALDKNSQKFIELIENAIKFSVEVTIESYYKSILNR